MTKWNILRYWKKVFSSGKYNIHKFFVSAFNAILVGILTVILGLAVPLISSDLEVSWPWCHLKQQQLAEGTQGNPEAKFKCEVSHFSKTGLNVIVFYSLVFLLALCLGGRELAIAGEAEKKRSELLNTIRTTPPPDVLDGFGGSYSSILMFIESQINISHRDGEERRQTIDNGIRLCLDSLSVFASNFQRSARYTRYGANIMLFIPVENISEEGRDDFLNKMQPYLERRTFEGLQGVLNLELDLSASNDNPNNSFERDDKLVPLALPIPEPEKSIHNGKQRYLPGAPTAFFEGNFIVDDTRLFLRRYDDDERDKYCEIPRSLMEKTHEYFVEGSEDSGGGLVRSFISLLIKENEFQNSRKLGVINIHCDRPCVFEDNWVSDSFMIFTKPVLIQIVKLLKMREQKNII